MTRTNKIIYWFIGVCIIILIILLSCVFNVSAGRIWDLAEQINSLQDKKQECYDNLTHKQSIQLYEWTERYCYERDDEILRLKEEQSKLTHHDYMNIKSKVGLVQE